MCPRRDVVGAFSCRKMATQWRSAKPAPIVSILPVVCVLGEMSVDLARCVSRRPPSPTSVSKRDLEHLSDSSSFHMSSFSSIYLPTSDSISTRERKIEREEKEERIEQARARTVCLPYQAMDMMTCVRTERGRRLRSITSRPAVPQFTPAMRLVLIPNAVFKILVQKQNPKFCDRFPRGATPSKMLWRILCA